MSVCKLGRGDLNWESACIVLSCRQVSQDTFLIKDWYGRAQPPVGGKISRQVVLGWISKQAKHVEQASKRCSMVSALVPTSVFLP